MSSCFSIFETSGGLLLLLSALFLMIGHTAIFVFSVHEKRSSRQMTAATLHLLAIFLLFVIILDGYDIVRFPNIPRKQIQTGWFLYDIPWLIYAFAEAVSALILARRFREYRYYRKTALTPNAIRAAVDLLPEGISVSAVDGTVLLANLKIDALCRTLSGERLSDARKFWTYLEKTGEDQEGKRLIHTPQNEVWLFAKDSLAEDGKFERISAVNVTGQYRINEELREKNTHLHDIQRRMKEAVVLSGEMFIKQEEANARRTLHNELGQVLLMYRHYIEHPDTTDAAMVALMTKQMNSFLLGESKAIKADFEDELHQAVSMAGSIGVTVDLQGDPVREENARSLLARAIRECAANTVKHAEGDTLYVKTTANEAGTLIFITNSGKPPKGPVAESGGLLSLRRSAEAAGGEMHVQSIPSFCLTLAIPHS